DNTTYWSPGGCSMEYGTSDSSGTDDDLPPPHQNRGVRGRITFHGRVGVSLAYPRVQADMETQIHQLEQEAYCSVLRAFKAQSDSLTWEKESVITELRKELKVSNVEHRELLSMVNADESIRRIREWRQAASRKRKKTSQSITSLPLNVPSPAMHSQCLGVSMQPSESASKHGAAGTKGKKPKPIPPTVPSGRGYLTNRGAPGIPIAKELVENKAHDLLIGKKVMTRWPEDNSFYEAVITDYDPQKGLHALVYDINTDNETWEWVNLKEISPEDIRWEGEDSSLPHRVHCGAGRGTKKLPPRHNSTASAGIGRGRGPLKHQSKKEFGISQNSIGETSDIVEILQTDTLLKEVEKLFNASHPKKVEVEKAKKLLKEHEQALTDAIARLADASDRESADCDQTFLLN
ncbi:hypothetical protein HPP92_017233, partial [Vanilla planifolia]